MTKHVRFSLNRDAGSTVSDADPLVRYGVLEDGRIHETAPLSAGRNGAWHEFSAVRLLPPTWPTKIVCVGRNYADHAKELGNEPPEEPIIFLKPNSCLAAHGDPIVYPRLTELLSYEGELALVIGRRGRNVPRARALDMVFGYTVINDVTARDLQRKDTQWTRAKGFDAFGPVGPWIVPRAEVDLDQVHVRTRVDGILKQNGSLMDLLFGLDVIIAYITEFMTLEPGDLIATGTPPGVGAMEPGSVVEVEVTGVGKLENRVIREEAL